MYTDEQIGQFLNTVDLTKFNNNYEQACFFYFRLLKELDLKIISASVQIQNNSFAHEKIKKQAKSLSKAKQESSSKLHDINQKTFLFECKVKGCNKGFDKKSALDYHQILKHKSQFAEWSTNKIFNIQIKQPIQSANKRQNKNVY